MHTPRPYGRFAGEAELSSEDAAAVELLARSVSNLKSASGLEHFKRVVDLPSGRQAVALDMGGTFRIIIQEKHEDPRFQFEGIAQTNIPMLFSGVINSSRLREGEGTRVRLTEQTRRRIAGYKGDLPARDVELQRFRIEYADKFRYFLPDNPGIFTYTQYNRLRPNWYSGAAAEVVQCISGYGRQDFEELPDLPMERARMVIPERYMTDIRRELSNVRLPGYTGFPDRDGQLKLDYAASACNGVAFDSENAPWLLRINARGVFAMPLPVIPATTTQAFRDYVESVGDEELRVLLDRFGGMPSGEGFPDSEQDFEAWRRAGVIIKVCDTADFYSHTPLYGACGWSLNTRGSEGFNTCKEYRSDGLLQIHSYMLRLNLGAAENRGLTGLTWEIDEQDGPLLDAYLSSLYATLTSNGARELAIKYKVRRTPVEDILARARSGAKGDRDYWDNLEIDPIANHFGSVTRVGSGPVYWPSKFPMSFGRIKFPELTGKGCESLMIVSEEYNGPSVRCDTVVFGCYVGDALQVIKYFYDDREFFSETESTFEDVMIVGSWEKTETTGLTGLMGYVYTSAFDDRQEAPPRSTHTEITGTDMGYGQPAYQTPALLFRVGSLSRSRYYMHRTKISTTDGFSIDAAACVPVYARDCIMYTYRDSTTGRSYTEYTTRGAVPDPTSYQLWCHDSIFHYMGQTGSGNRGVPPSIDGTPVYVDTLVYSPTEISDFADSGNWFNLPAGGFIDVTGVCGPYTSRSSSTHHAGGVLIGGEAPGFNPYSFEASYPGEASGRFQISQVTAGDATVHRMIPSAFAWEFSPQPPDLYYQQDATWNVLGEQAYASIYEKDHTNRRKRWGDSQVANHDAPNYFIGVINE